MRSSWALLGACGGPVAMPSDQTVELRVGTDSFTLGLDVGRLTVRGGSAHLPAATVTMPPETLYQLLAGRLSATGAQRHSTVDGDHRAARSILNALHGAATTSPVEASS